MGLEKIMTICGGVAMVGGSMLATGFVLVVIPYLNKSKYSTSNNHEDTYNKKRKIIDTDYEVIENDRK